MPILPESNNTFVFRRFEDGKPSGEEKGKGIAREEEGSMENLEMFLENMKLQGEEEDLDFSGEFEELVKEIQWLALFRVHTTKPFSHAALFSALRNAWAPAKEVTFKVLEPNLFLVQLNCLGDWSRVMEGHGYSEAQRLSWKNMMVSQM